QPIRGSFDWSDQRIELADERHALGRRGRTNGLQGRLHDRTDIHTLKVEPHPPRTDACQINEVIDQSRLGGGIADDRVDGTGSCRVVQSTALDQASPAKDGVEGGAELVGYRGEELVLRSIEHFGFAARLLLLPQQQGSLLFQASSLADV